MGQRDGVLADPGLSLAGHVGGRRVEQVEVKLQRQWIGVQAAAAGKRCHRPDVAGEGNPALLAEELAGDPGALEPGVDTSFQGESWTEHGAIDAQPLRSYLLDFYVHDDIYPAAGAL